MLEARALGVLAADPVDRLDGLEQTVIGFLTSGVLADVEDAEEEADDGE